VFVPAALCKEGADKYVDLTVEETTILREQLLGRAAGTSLVFPTKTGRPWRHFQFLRLVWYKARSRAATTWRERERLPQEADTPFEWWTVDKNGEPAITGVQPHDLRATAATMMRDAGFLKEQAAARLGHADSGQLLDRIYDVGDRRARMRKAIDALAPRGLRAALAEPAPQPSASPAAEGSTNLRTR
jgi:integrase